MSFFLDAENNAEDSAVVVSDETGDNTFNFFGTSASKEENNKCDLFDTMFNQSVKEKDDNNARDNLLFRCSPGAKKLKLAENLSAVSNVIRTAKGSDDTSEVKWPTSGKQPSKQDDVMSSVKNIQNSRSQNIKSADCEKPQDDGTYNGKRNREDLIYNNNGSAGSIPLQSRSSSMRAQFTHPMQMNNERSPSSSCFQLPTIKEQSETSDEALKSKNSSTQKPVSSFCEKLLARHSMTIPSIQQSPAVGASQTPPVTETTDLAEALKSFEYEPLKEQLSNLPAAKQAGKFTEQVALSVEALFQCSDREKTRKLTAIQNTQAQAKEKICRMHETLTSELQQVDDYHQAVVDQKLSKLSNVLHEVTTTQEELAKFKQLLRSLTADLSAEQ